MRGRQAVLRQSPSQAPSTSSNATQRRSRADRSNALMVRCTMAPWAKSPWFVVAAADDLVGEVPHQVGVEQERPRLPAGAAGREVALGDLPLDELDRVLGRGLDRLADAELLDQAHDDRALGAVEPRLDAGVVADGHVGGLDGGQHVGRRTRTATCRRRRCSSAASCPVERTMRTGTKLRMVPTTLVSGRPTHQCMMSMIGAP